MISDVVMRILIIQVSQILGLIVWAVLTRR
jgi:hypothetical protein